MHYQGNQTFRVALFEVVEVVDSSLERRRGVLTNIHCHRAELNSHEVDNKTKWRITSTVGSILVLNS